MTPLSTTCLANPVPPGDAPVYPKVHDNALLWLKHIEQYELGSWIALTRDAALSMAPGCLDPKVSLPRKSRIIGLLAAQIHPDAVAWLRLLSRKCDPELRPLAQVAWKQSVVRAQVLGLCLSASSSTGQDIPRVECS